jgi:hypothetical protein
MAAYKLANIQHAKANLLGRLHDPSFSIFDS